ncbi:VWA domain-containing protein [Pseudomonadota bacterium]
MLRLTFHSGRILALYVSCMLLLFSAPQAAVAEEKADARVLIDVSGSMKDNDPQNLRRPALRLLVGLLPPDTRAGIWTFGQYVNMQVPLGQVNDGWKKRARKGASEIHSRGLFTNIEEALLRSTKDWTEPDADYRRHIVLLTDGMVDVSKDPEASAASRQRIIKDILPRLKKLGVQVHTIALSERADHDLMKNLAVTTGGWYEQVNDADRLKRVFLRIFEKVGRPDTLPLKGNRFRVDRSIKEVTLLVFHDATAGAATRVVTPKGKKFGLQDAPANVTWHQDEGYDLLTIDKPEAGKWRIEAKVDPDNRVMVVTDLKMKSSEVPNLVAIGEQVPLTAHFTDQGHQINQKVFLDVLNVNVEQRIGDEEEASEPQPLYDDGEGGDEKADDGLFTVLLGAGWSEGQAELVVTAGGKTFRREQRQTFRIRPPVVLEATEQDKDGKSGVNVRLIPDTDVIDPVGIEPQAWLQKSGGAREGFILTPEGEGVWSTWVDTSTFADNRSLSATFTAMSHAGNPVQLDLGPVDVKGGLIEEKPPVAVAPEPQPVAEPEAPAEPPAEESGSSMVVMLGVGNLAVLILGVVGYLMWHRSKQKDLVSLVDEEDEDEDTEVEMGMAETDAGPVMEAFVDSGSEEVSETAVESEEEQVLEDPVAETADESDEEEIEEIADESDEDELAEIPDELDEEELAEIPDEPMGEDK